MTFRLAQPVDVRLAEANPVTGSLLFHILQGDPARAAAAIRRCGKAQGDGSEAAVSAIDEKATVFRLGFLIVLLLAATAHAEPAANGAGFDQALTANVAAAALAFMAPRTLDPVPISQLTVWGLRGLTALDPQLTAELRDDSLRLSLADSILLAHAAAPPDRRPGGLGRRLRDAGGRRLGRLARACATPARSACCKASSTRCSTISTPIRATCRPVRRPRTASGGRAAPAWA